MSEEKSLLYQVNRLSEIAHRISDAACDNKAVQLNFPEGLSGHLAENLEQLAKVAEALLVDFNKAVDETKVALKQGLHARFEKLMQDPKGLITCIKEDQTKAYVEIMELPDELLEEILRIDGVFLAVCDDKSLSAKKRYDRASTLFYKAGKEQEIKLTGTDGVIPLLCYGNVGFECYTVQFMALPIEKKEKFALDYNDILRISGAARSDEEFRQDMHGVIDGIAKRDPFPLCRVIAEHGYNPYSSFNIHFKDTKDWFLNLTNDQRRELVEIAEENISTYYASCFQIIENDPVKKISQNSGQPRDRSLGM